MRIVVEWVRKYERRLGYTALLGGFIVDSLTLRRIDLLPENLAIISYLAVILFSILLMHLDAGKFHRFGIIPRLAPFLPITMQFAFGALFSGFVIFYSRSAAVGASWPFLLLLVLLLIGNESFRGRYERLNFRLGLFFFGLLTYSVLALPVFIGEIGDHVFMVSVVIAMFLSALVIEGLRRLAPDIVDTERKILYAIVVGVSMLFSLAYFYNIIPPVPLILKSAGVAHEVKKVAPGTYQAQVEPKKNFGFTTPIFHRAGNEPAYVWSSIFAPAQLSTTVLHVWYLKDSVGVWKVMQTVPIEIVGGRDGGFRGYSLRSSLTAGEWRVDVQTPRGQLLGRINFKVEAVSAPVALKRFDL